MDMGIPLIPNPSHPGDFRAEVRAVAIAPTAVQKDTRSPESPILRLCGGTWNRQGRNQDDQREERRPSIYALHYVLSHTES
jgi:hypothetical protein